MAAPPVQSKVLADKRIGSEIKPETEEQEKQYEDLLDKKDKSDQASALCPQMARVIRWNVPGQFHQNAHRLLKKITEHPNILTRNENGKAVVYGDAILVVISNRYSNQW